MESDDVRSIEVRTVVCFVQGSKFKVQRGNPKRRSDSLNFEPVLRQSQDVVSPSNHGTLN